MSIQPMTIFELYQSTLLQPCDDLSLRDLPVDSNCGRECAKAIFAGRVLMDHCEAAGTCSAPVIETVDEIVGIYWRG